MLSGAMLPIWSELSQVVQRVHDKLVPKRFINGKEVKTRPQLRVVHIEQSAAATDSAPHACNSVSSKGISFAAHSNWGPRT